jgi:carbon storage regulator
LATAGTFRARLRIADPERQGPSMLVLTRKSNQSIMIGDDVEVTVLSVTGDKVRIGIQAPGEVPVFRTEIYLEIRRGEGDGLGSEDGGTDARAEVDQALRELGGGEPDQ